MRFAGRSDDAEGPEAVSAYKATSVESIIEGCFVRCKNPKGCCLSTKTRMFAAKKIHMNQQTRGRNTTFSSTPPAKKRNISASHRVARPFVAAFAALQHDPASHCHAALFPPAIIEVCPPLSIAARGISWNAP